MIKITLKRTNNNTNVFGTFNLNRFLTFLTRHKLIWLPVSAVTFLCTMFPSRIVHVHIATDDIPLSLKGMLFVKASVASCIICKSIGCININGQHYVIANHNFILILCRLEYLFLCFVSFIKWDLKLLRKTWLPTWEGQKGSMRCPLWLQDWFCFFCI